MIVIREATYADVLHIISNLHPLDKQELETTSGKPALESIPDLILSEHETFVVCPVLGGEEGLPVSLFGCTADKGTEGAGILWMLSTKMLLTTSRDLIRVARSWFDKWLALYPLGLHNVIDGRNERHIRWLTKMGAKFDRTRVAIIGEPPTPFYHFRIN